MTGSSDSIGDSTGASVGTSTGNTLDPSQAAKPGSHPTTTVETELVKALQELTRGEKAAASIEQDLSKLEQKLDEILAAFESGLDEDTNNRKENSQKGLPEPESVKDDGSDAKKQG